MQRSDLRRANQLKTEILGTVAHDLKNPLAVILGRAEMLGDLIGSLPQPVEAMRAQVGHIRDSARRLTGMIESLIADAMNDALDITLRREPVDFAGLAREVTQANAPLAETKNQVLRARLPDSLFICGDGERLREAMDNLISNAIKYSPVGAEIVVSVERTGDETLFAVRDFGPGLSPEDTGRLFGRFQRLSAKPTGGEGSTGLGLSIVKRIAELHGGRASAESHAPEPGSTFAIHLPNIAVELA
jgi:signal transduction histidine kinase